MTNVPAEAGTMDTLQPVLPDGANGRSLLARTPGELRTSELLAVVLGAEDTGRELLESCGGLRTLAGLSAEELSRRRGVGSVRAARLLASIELGRRALAERLPRGTPIRSSADIFRHFHVALRDLRVEQFRVMLLDGKHRVLRQELVSQGTLTSSPVHPREVFGPAIRRSAAAVVLVHNHPSGDPTPSTDDLDITRRLVDVGELVGIRVLDHVIVGDGAYTSLADRGLLAK